MKKIFFKVILAFLLLFSVWGLASATTVSIWSSSFSTLESWTSSGLELPYCKNTADCGFEKWVEMVKNWKINSVRTEGTVVSYIQDVVRYLLWFLMVITVLIIIYAWTIILTASGNDDKVEKAKKIITYAIIWLIVIFLSYPLSAFVIDVLNQGAK